MNYKETGLFATGNSMDIYARAGTKVYFLGENGYDSERERAKEIMTIGQVYVVVDTDVGSCSSTVTLEEFPGKQFNTVMFGELRPYRDPLSITNQIQRLMDELKETLEHKDRKLKEALSSLVK